MKLQIGDDKLKKNKKKTGIHILYKNIEVFFIVKDGFGAEFTHKYPTCPKSQSMLTVIF